jgi:hypothetical protein
MSIKKIIDIFSFNETQLILVLMFLVPDFLLAQSIVIGGLPRKGEVNDEIHSECFKVFDKLVVSSENNFEGGVQLVFSLNVYAGPLLEQTSLIRRGDNYELRTVCFIFESFNGWAFKDLNARFNEVFKNRKIPSVTLVTIIADDRAVKITQLIDAYLDLGSKVNFGVRRNGGRQFVRLTRMDRIYYVDAPSYKGLWFDLVINALFEEDLNEVKKVISELRGQFKDCSVLLEGRDYKVLTPEDLGTHEERASYGIPLEKFTPENRIDALPRFIRNK